MSGGRRGEADVADRFTSGESGFTIVELLVTITISIVILLALFAYQDTALRQTSSVFTRVDATQTARTLITNVERELSTACVAEAAAPIKAGSTGSQIKFINGYGSTATVSPTQHVMGVTGSDPANTFSTFTDTIYGVSGGAAPNWVFSTTPAAPTRQLASKVMQVDGATPIFRYYAYDIARDQPATTSNPSAGSAYLDSSGNPYRMLLDGSAGMPNGVTTSAGTAVTPGKVPENSPKPLTTPLTATDAANVAAVLITMKVGSSGGNNVNSNLAESSANVSNQVVLRLTQSASDSSSLAIGPCR